MIDAYSKFVQIVPLKNKQMDTVAAAIYDNWLSLFTVPKLLVTDLGSEFSGSMCKFLASQFGFEHSFSSPQHPQSNGAAEASVKGVLNYVRKYIEVNDWLPHLRNVRLAHNTNIHSSIQTTPFQAAFCHRPRLPGDILRHALLAIGAGRSRAA